MIIIAPIGVIIALTVLSWLLRETGCGQFLGCFTLALLGVGLASLGEHLGWWGPVF